MPAYFHDLEENVAEWGMYSPARYSPPDRETRLVEALKEYTNGDILIQTKTIIDYDDDGGDEDGRPIMRPIYERIRVPGPEIEFIEKRKRR